MLLTTTVAMPDRATELCHLCTAAGVIGAVLPLTPQYRWPLLSQAMDTTVWVKCESHAEVGALKVRGGLTYLHALRQCAPQVHGVIAATRGNHGQSTALTVRRDSLIVTIVVPHGNSVGKNATIRVLGVELLGAGGDSQAGHELANQLAAERGLHFVLSYHDDLAAGVASCWLEFFEATSLDAVYVLIGMSLGTYATVRARNALALSTHIAGVVSARVRCYEQSLKSGTVVPAPVSTLLADRLAYRMPDADALEVVRTSADRIIMVTDDGVVQAIRLYFSTAHNVTEGATAVALAEVRQQREQTAGQRIDLSLIGDDTDRVAPARVLAD